MGDISFTSILKIRTEKYKSYLKIDNTDVTAVN